MAVVASVLANAPVRGSDRALLTEAAPHGAVWIVSDNGVNHVCGPDGGTIDWDFERGVLTVRRDPSKEARGVWTTLHFRDARVHCEFRLPDGSVGDPDGNSGLYFHGLYEQQIRLPSDDPNEDRTHLPGALYGFAPPLSRAGWGAGVWQTYDIVFRAPTRDPTGRIVAAGAITASLNGVLVQDGTPFGEPQSRYAPLRFRTTPHVERIAESLRQTGYGPLHLQDHGAPVAFRNLWIHPLGDDGVYFEDRRRSPPAGTAKPAPNKPR